MSELHPIEWRTNDAATGPVPCRWAGWLNGVYIEIMIVGE